MKNIIYIMLILMSCVILGGILHIFIISPMKSLDENKQFTKKEYFIENNMKYLLINDKEIINITKDSLECKFYEISNLPENN